jgi:hypothetical protein
LTFAKLIWSEIETQKNHIEKDKFFELKQHFKSFQEMNLESIERIPYEKFVKYISNAVQLFEVNLPAQQGFLYSSDLIEFMKKYQKQELTLTHALIVILDNNQSIDDSLRNKLKEKVHK